MKNEYSLVAKIVAPHLSKGDRKKISILKGSLRVLGQRGAEALNYNILGKELGINRSLIAHYYPDKKELFVHCVQLIVLEAQEVTIAKVSKARNLRQFLRNYIDATVDLFEEKPEYTAVMVLLYHYCAIDKKMHAFHESFRTMGAQRLVAGIGPFLSQASLGPMHLKHALAIQKIVRSLIIERSLAAKRVALVAEKKQALKECLLLLQGGTEL